MHILFLLTQDLESPSGVGRYLPLARGLVQCGHQVTVAALHSRFDVLRHRRFEQDGVKVRYVAQMHVRKKGNTKSYYPAHQLIPLMMRAALALTWAAVRVSADVTHIGKPHPMNSVAGLVAKHVQGKCTFLDYDDYEAGSNRFSGEWQRRVVSCFENWVPSQVHHITTHNHFLLNRLLALGIPRKRVTYLPNGVNIERFAKLNPTQVEDLRAKFDLEGKKVTAFIGTLSLPSHPVDLLLDAFPRVLEANPQNVLMIVGGGEDYEQLKQRSDQMRLGGSVIFSGRVPSSEVPLYYALADVVVDPARDDAASQGRLPLKLFESWASGTPFVTADVGDRGRVLGSPPAGILVEPGSPEALSRGILEVVLDETRADVLRRRGEKRVHQYDWTHLAKTMGACYSKALRDWEQRTDRIVV
jgi:glycosyltransferase involved in cell wall biosynthesis